MAQVGARATQQRRLRAELRRIREGAGHTQKAAAEALGWSMSKIIRIETGVVPVSPADVMALLHVYELDDKALADELVGITRSKEEMWWDAYRKHLSPQFLDWLDYENSACHIKEYIGFAVPGLLQTEAYATALLDSYGLDAETVKHRVEVKMRRQEQLSEKDGVRATFVLDEAVLHRRIGSATVMRDQLARLKEAAREPTVTMRVVPFDRGTHRAMISSFVVMELAPGIGDPVVLIEDPHRDTVIREDTETTGRFLETFRELEEFAAGPDQVDAIVDSVMETMRHKP